MVQLVEMALDRFSPILYQSLGIFLPLIAVNCAILGSSLFMVEREYGFIESAVFGSSAGAGFSGNRYPCNHALQAALFECSSRLRGLGIAMLLTGLISMAYMSFSGINL